MTSYEQFRPQNYPKMREMSITSQENEIKSRKSAFRLTFHGEFNYQFQIFKISKFAPPMTSHDQFRQKLA